MWQRLVPFLRLGQLNSIRSYVSFGSCSSLKGIVWQCSGKSSVHGLSRLGHRPWSVNWFLHQAGLNFRKLRFVNKQTMDMEPVMYSGGAGSTYGSGCTVHPWWQNSGPHCLQRSKLQLQQRSKQQLQAVSELQTMCR